MQVRDQIQIKSSVKLEASGSLTLSIVNTEHYDQPSLTTGLSQPWFARISQISNSPSLSHSTSFLLVPPGTRVKTRILCHVTVLLQKRSSFITASRLFGNSSTHNFSWGNVKVRPKWFEKAMQSSSLLYELVSSGKYVVPKSRAEFVHVTGQIEIGVAACRCSGIGKKDPGSISDVDWAPKSISEDPGAGG